MAGRNQSFFHGTTHDIGIGGQVLAGRESGKSNYKGSMGYARQRSDRHAYASEREDEAWEFAGRKVDASADQAIKQGSPTSKSQRARVYEVESHPMMRKGVYHPDHPLNRKDVSQVHEWIAPHYRVKAVHDIMPGRQGTFPTINWNQFSAKPLHADANHPHPNQVEEGHGYALVDWHSWDPPPKHEEVRGQLSLFPHPGEKG